jgi:Putative MetA-pathway of phenol degradation
MRCAFASLLLLVPTSASAELVWPEANPGRPSFSDNAAPTATGAFEVETGLTTDDKFDSGTAQWTLKYGISDHFDVRLNFEHTVWGANFDLVGSSLLLKYSLRHPDDGVLGLAVEPYLTFPSLPNGPEGFGGGALLVGTYITNGFQIDANAILDVATADMAATTVTFTPVVAIGHDLVGDLAGYVEPGIDLGLAGGGGRNAFVGVGLGYSITKFLIVDAAFYVGEDPQTQVFVGLTYSMYLPPRHRT